MQTYVRFGALMLGAMLLTACGLGKENTTEIFNAKYYLYAVDHEGNLNIIGDNGAGKTKALKTIAFKNAKNQALNLGEVQFHQDYAYVVISNGLDQDAAGQDTEDHGGVLVVNMDDYTIVNTVHLRTQLKDKNNAPVPTRIVHTFADPDGTHLWLNNDGYSAPKDAATQDQRDLAALKDSVFRLNWDNEGGTEYLLVDEIRDGIGNGHKKSALSFSTTALPTTPKLFATHNLSDQTVSIVNNDATSVDFLKAATPIALNSDPSVKQNTPHGLTFSPLSGRFYVGITSGVDKGLAIIDAATRTLSSLPAGPADEMKIPAGGYVHANADG
ncbi:MAG: hypothetical protein OEW08_04945, partial [Gammaproteobacteria bacterium]|nr:hypothetical protein [Gammaproteobacteria bacterium]